MPAAASCSSSACIVPAMVSCAPGAAVVGRRLLLLALAVVSHAEEDHGDVVPAAALVGGANQRLGRLLEARRRAQEGAQLLVAHHARQPVGADQEEVAVLPGHRVGVHLHARLRPERPRDDRTLGVVLGRLRGDLAGPLELGHQRVVAGDLLELPVTHQVGPAVADVTQAHLAARDLGRRERRAHAAMRLVARRQLVDAAVGLLENPRELRLRGLIGGAGLLEHARGQCRRDLPGARAAHAVGDAEERRREHGRVLVGAALAADVGAPGLFDDADGHGATPGSGTRCPRCESHRPS